MRIIVKSKNVTNQRPYKDRLYGEQQAALMLDGADFPLAFKLNVQADAPHEPGEYRLDPSSFGTDQHGNLRLNRVRLGARIAPAAVAPKAA